MNRTRNICDVLIGIVLVSALGVVGCSRGPGPIAKDEPAGQAVELTAEDQQRVRWAYDDMKKWAAWHNKGTHLLSTRQGGTVGPEDQQQALYCFHQALAAWPAKLADTEPEARRNKHKPEPTDTLLQIGWLYLKMNQPAFARAYFQRAQTYLPYSDLVSKGIADAEAQMKKG